jgi:hypothetical protein
MARVVDAVVTAVAPLYPELRQFWLDKGQKLVVKDPTERELFIEVERLFGNKLISYICIPFNVQTGACITLAIEIMRKYPEELGSEFFEKKS